MLEMMNTADGIRTRVFRRHGCTSVKLQQTSQHTPRLKPGDCNSPLRNPGTGVATLERRRVRSQLGRLTRCPTNTPWDVSQAPDTERSLQVVLADKALAFMPICAWNNPVSEGILSQQTVSQGGPRVPLHLACSLFIVSWLSRLLLNIHKLNRWKSRER